VDIIESDECLIISLGNAGSAPWVSLVLGACVNDIDGVARWAIMPCVDTVAQDLSGVKGWAVPPILINSTSLYRGIVETGVGSSTVRVFGRHSSPAQCSAGVKTLLVDGSGDTHLLPVHLVCSRINTPAPLDDWRYLGTARQIKWGPGGPGGVTLQASGVDKAHSIGGDQGSTLTHPAWASVDP
jgi:hypothetical protein